MGHLFRSEDMSLCSMCLQAEAAPFCIAELGKLGLVQFRDLNEDVQSFQRRFLNDVRRAEDMERQLRYFEKEMETSEVPKQKATDEEKEVLPTPKDLDRLEAIFTQKEKELRDSGQAIVQLKRNQLELMEVKHLLKNMETFLETQAMTDVHGNMEPDVKSEEVKVGYLCGVMKADRIHAMMRLFWFACHRNVLVRYAEIDEPLVDTLDLTTPVKKVVFAAFYQGDRLKQKVKKIAESFKASIYGCPESISERLEMSAGVMKSLADIEMVMNQSQESRLVTLKVIARNLEAWFIMTKELKAIYHVMGMLQCQGQNYFGECWVPTEEIGTVQGVLKKATDAVGISSPSLVCPINTNDVHPTYFRTNKFTYAFQMLVDSYGVAVYKEVNPAPYGVITFPFLFSVMFGDTCHGVLVLAFALFLVTKEKMLEKSGATKNEMFGIIFGGRYLVLLMGLFSIYSGIMYNDFFSKPVNIFGSAWDCPYDNETLEHATDFTLDPNNKAAFSGSPYPYGFDPVWALSLNKITFTNSFKEKISVIFGITQMMAGVILSLFNHMYFRQPLNIICEFIPEMIFLSFIFVYLCLIIFVKWIKFTPAMSGDAPNLLIGFINMFLMNYSDAKAIWYPGQQNLQTSLLIIALLSAIFLLLAKPIILKIQHGRKQKDPEMELVGIENMAASPDTQSDIYENASENGGSKVKNHAAAGGHGGGHGGHGGHGEEFDMGEIFIHQAIHMIEFCLGCVSHTASYLRLWALSLAHNQLSEVLWTMVLRIGLSGSGAMGIILLFLTFAPFAVLTVVILVLMEGLSAFLHTLRLHWVEFQSKFYKGDGIPFTPFRFKTILSASDEV